ncbi:hypothetical protein [Streptomyces rubrogriseus]|nr:hypothetical protein [Streptomyces rubrogriseus]
MDLLRPDMAMVPAAAAALRELRSVAGELRERFDGPESDGL